MPKIHRKWGRNKSQNTPKENKYKTFGLEVKMDF